MEHKLPLNAFSAITIQSLVSNSGVFHPQTFHRGIVKPVRQLKVGSELHTRQGGFPPRPPSNLPPPGDKHLTLGLGEKLGSGRVGSVYTVNVEESDYASRLPPLVVKISRPKRSANMAEEAWFYEEAEYLQGVAVPRCYGFFQARLHEGEKVVTWDRKQDEDQGESEEGEEGNKETGDDVNLDGETDECFVQYILGMRKYESDGKEYKKLVQSQEPGDGPLLTILLLERLGERIPVGKPVDSIKADVYEIFNDLARSGLEPLDIRWSNILSTYSESETDLQTCPNHGHAHRWRLVDFDLSRQTDCTTECIDSWTDSWIRRLFNNLVKGRIIEPWH